MTSTITGVSNFSATGSVPTSGDAGSSYPTTVADGFQRALNNAYFLSGALAAEVAERAYVDSYNYIALSTAITNSTTADALLLEQARCKTQASNWPVRPVISNSAASSGVVPMAYNYDQEKIIASTADTHSFYTSDGYAWIDNGSYGGDLGSAASAIAYVYSGSTFTPCQLMFATSSGNVLKSTTNFVSYTIHSSGAPTGAVVATNPEAVIGVDIRIIAAGAANVFKYSDGGDIWNTVTGWFGGWAGATKRAHFFRSQDSAFKGFYFLADGTNASILFKSANLAAATECVVPSKSWVGIASSFLQKQIMVVASDGTCYVSTDPESAFPATFSATTTLPNTVYDLACDGDRLWVALTSSGVHYSTDFGASWKLKIIANYTVAYKNLYYMQGKFWVARSNGSVLEINASEFKSPPLGNWNPNGI